MNHYLEIRQACPLCFGKNFTFLYDVEYEEPELKKYLSEFYTNKGIIEYEYLEGAHYSLLKCQQCGLIFQKAIPGSFLASRLYDHWISPEISFKNRLSKLTIGEYWNFVSDFTKIISYLGKPASEISVFDFGMGWGTTLSILKSMGCKVYGNEIAQSRIDYAEAGGITNLKADMLQAMTFDYIHAYQVFEHVNNPRGELSNMVGLLREDGLIRISVPNGNGIERLIPNITWGDPNASKKYIAIGPLEHINCFTYETLLKLGDSCGLEPVRVKLPMKYQNIYQFLRSTIRGPYRFFKYGDTGKMPDVIFRKKKSSNIY